MNILFIHANFPGQFIHLARSAGADPRHRVVFLTERADAAKDAMEGVALAYFKPTRAVADDTHHYLKASEWAVLNGQAVLRSLAGLLEQGVRPDLIVCHGGNGLSLFLKDLLPQVPVVLLVEWWCRPETSRWLVEEFTLDERLRVGLRDLVTQQELLRCDRAVVPTQWQADQFPDVWRQRLTVIFDGIDTTLFKPAPPDHPRAISLQGEENATPIEIPASAKLLSYATRGMEPLRGFPEFMRALPSLLQQHSDLEVVIAGRDRVAYSYPAPGCGGSWKQFLLEELGSFPGRERIHFTGLLNYGQYRQLLWRSDCHCSLSRPYVISWSLFEAAACGARLVINSDPWIKTSLREGTDAVGVDIDQPGALQRAINGVVQRGTSRRESQLLEEMALSHCIKQWSSLIKEISG